jgi:arylsulfatase A-like enzyme
VRRGVLLLLALAMLACPGAQKPAPTPTPSPRAATETNVLLVTIDTLRADHLGVYGYARNTSPHIDALAREGMVFDQAYTFWPKTRASFVMMHTGRRPSLNGYSKAHPVLLDFNPTIASALKDAGYATAALVDNANLSAANGYSKGFDSYRETWQDIPEVEREMDRARAITGGGVAFLRDASRRQPFFLWLHYVNPHAPYTPPAPYDTAFLDDTVAKTRQLPVVRGLKGGIPAPWAVKGQDRLGYYVAQYDGEIAAADQEVGRVLEALRASPIAGHTLVILTSDHGESLGEHDYFFDHGADLFDPCLRVPLIVAAPGGRAGRTSALASTLDLFPTVLDAVKRSYTPDLAGFSLLPAALGSTFEPRTRLFAENDMNMSATFDQRFKLVAEPVRDKRRLDLFDRESDPGETKNVSREKPEDLRVHLRELEIFFEKADREWARTRPLTEGKPEGERPQSKEACEQIKALGYLGCQ